MLLRRLPRVFEVILIVRVQSVLPVRAVELFREISGPGFSVFVVVVFLLLVVVVFVVRLKLRPTVAASGVALGRRGPARFPGLGGSPQRHVVAVPADHLDVGHTAAAAVELLDEL